MLRPFLSATAGHALLALGFVLWPHPSPIEFPPTTGRHAIYVARVIDGDTFEGFYLVRQKRFRLYGCNAPERNDLGGKEAKHALEAMLQPGTVKTVELLGDDKFGGVLAKPKDDLGQDVVLNLIAAGHARAWTGKGEKP